ncbi:MAG TPA: metallophosphoesterase family protein, partial [Anaerolineae bacterium]|nr:metallophosphoesterase family protein [Anaerolineae bacterium]
MRYLVISDIHANLAAFEAVLEDPRGVYDKVLCLGGMVCYGPDPHEGVELLLTLDHLCIAGNHD